MKGKKDRRRWLQFGVRGLILLMLLAGLGAFWLRNEVLRAREQRLAVERIQGLGGSVTFDHEYTVDRQWKDNPLAPGPRWLERVLGENIFLTPRTVTLRPDPMMRFDMQNLETMDALTQLRLNYVGWTSRPESGDGGVQPLAKMRQLAHDRKARSPR